MSPGPSRAPGDDGLPVAAPRCGSTPEARALQAIRPVLAGHGFALSFRTGREGQQITVTGVLSHRLGHSEQTTMQLPTDVTGAKNPVQAIGSSTSYGKRYVAMRC